MPSWIKTVYQGGQGEITEKKSRFIATVCPVHSESEALAFIEKTKKKYWDARHNCYAYILGENQTCMRSSDDGEPQGTAGHPMLDVLTGEEIYDVAVVVTRYFGGVLLGTGGLVRAYSQAVQEGLKNCTLMEKRRGIPVWIETEYTGLGKLQYMTASRQITVLETLYEDSVKMKILLEPDQVAVFRGEVMDATSGKALWQEQEEIFYGKLEDRILVEADLTDRED